MTWEMEDIQTIQVARTQTADAPASPTPRPTDTATAAASQAAPPTATSTEVSRLATLDLLEATSSPASCDGVCIYTVQGTLAYTTPVLPANVQCVLSGVQNGYSEVVFLDKSEGSLTLSASNPEPGKYGEDNAVIFFGCTLDAEGLHLAVSVHQPHAEMLVGGN
jgi:hypothetical protein